MNVRRLLAATATVASTAALLSATAPPSQALPQSACHQWIPVQTHDDKPGESVTHEVCTQRVPIGDPEAWREVPAREIAEPPKGPQHDGPEGRDLSEEERRKRCAVIAQELADTIAVLESAKKERDAAADDLEAKIFTANAAYGRYRKARDREQEEAESYRYILEQYFGANPDLHPEVTIRDGSRVLISTEINLFRTWGETAYVAARQRTQASQETIEAWQEWSSTTDPARATAQWRLDSIDETIAKTPWIIEVLEEDLRRYKC